MKKADYAKEDNYAYRNGSVAGVFVPKEASPKGNFVINLDVATVHGTGKAQKNIFSKVKIFTKDIAVVDEYRVLAEQVAALKNEKMGRFKYIELEGIVAGKDLKGIKERRSDDRQLYVIAKPEDIRISDDPKAFKLEKDDAATLDIIKGNISSLTMHPEHGFAEMSIAVDFGPKDKNTFFVKCNVNDNNGESEFAKAEKKLYEDLSSGEIGIGDQVKVSGRMENNNYEKNGEKVFASQVAVYGLEVLVSKAEKRNVKAAPAEAPAAAPAETAAKVEVKEEKPKRATSQRRRANAGKKNSNGPKI